ncbi:PREDICTED: uncharacterized protein LOC107331684 [Acropora digitifera]|uniref:uncharacterized protein LOC107331684 n=1 Tax=Acropora digitifera TaxID=70779 RepID=UPI00077AA3A5|nr:PREDICTED: uncharacterized protein LOC107331684 [Acropora digitifera]
MQRSIAAFFTNKRVTEENISTEGDRPAKASRARERQDSAVEQRQVSSGHCLYDLPSDILEHIFQFFKVQDCLNIVARVCRRFYKIVNDSGALWRSLKTDAEFDVDSFELVIVNHAKHFRDLALQFSQKRVRYNSPAMHIENTLALCKNLRHLDLSYNTSITTIEFLSEINCLTSLILTGCTSIEPNNTMNRLKYNGSCKC